MMEVWGFPGSSVGKDLPDNAGDAGSIPGLGRFPGKDIRIHSSILAWEIPRTVEPGGLQSMRSQRARYTLATKQYDGGIGYTLGLHS